MSQTISVPEYCYRYWNNPFMVERPPVVPLVQIEPTNYCNLKCIQCPSLISKYPKGYIDKRLFFMLADQLAENYLGAGPSTKMFFLGEPLLHPDIVELLAYAYKRRMTYTLETNAQLLDEEMAKKIIPVTNYLMVSINGTDAESYEKIRVGGSYKRLVENLERFVRLRDKLNPKMLMGITGITPKGESREGYYERFVRKWGYITPHISVAPFTDYKGVSWVNKGGEKVASKITGRREHPCQYGLQGLIVRWDGKVSFCCGDIHGEMIVGDAWKEPLYNIWNSERLVKMHLDIKAGKYDTLSLCKKCGAYGRSSC